MAHANQETTEWVARLCSGQRLPGRLTQKGHFEFRLADKNSIWPDVVLGVEDDGLYICTYGGAETDAIIGGLVAELAAKFAAPGFALFEL